METRILNCIAGYVRIRITGNSYDRFLNLCAYHGIFLWELTACGDAYEACIARRDFRRLKAIVRKSHTSVRIVRRYGLPFFIHRYRKRRFYIAGIAAALLFMFWLSGHIWNITIDGNLSQTDDVIFEYLTQEGVTHGMRRSAVDCKALASQIRNYFTQFSWVAAELRGTRLMIHVKEGILGAEDGDGTSPGEGKTQYLTLGADDPVPALAASKSGTVVSVYVRSGLPLVSPGDQVEQGTLLVTGAIPVTDDGGGIVSWQYVEPDADIVLRTVYPYRDEVTQTVQEKVYTGNEKTRWLFRAGNFPFSLPGPLCSWETYDVTSKLVQLRIMDNFYLPVYLQEFAVREYEIQEMLRTKEQCEAVLTRNLQNFMKNLEEKGVQIFENDVKIEWNEESAIASGTLVTGESAVRRVEAERTKEE